MQGWRSLTIEFGLTSGCLPEVTAWQVGQNIRRWSSEGHALETVVMPGHSDRQTVIWFCVLPRGSIAAKASQPDYPVATEVN